MDKEQNTSRVDHMTYQDGMEEISSDIMNQVIKSMKEYDYNIYTVDDVKSALSHEDVWK